ncbi:hypothetical protein TWF103_001948 [Orbilia oligospora]|uniref:CUE domain-containing protein n=1 Tax=Orbilia oligospora TaxID=2813651 RepID=A0A7C8NFF9_ORBOL|nr:hypothetical protein TWF103_001948 [Orbilia oligospora]KAF3118460.1 hypothetical protein TWF703_005542 [Orbilia oligospora]
MPSDQIFFASIPPYKSRSKLSPPTVDRCLTHWATALHTLRHLPDPLFTQQITPTSSFTKFLLSYISNDDLSHSDTDDWVYPSTSTSSPKSSTQRQEKGKEEETITTKVKYINRSLRLCLKRAISLGINISEIFSSNYSYYIKLGASFFVEGGSKPLLRSIWNHDNSVLVTATKEHLKSISKMLQDLASGKITVGDQHIAVLQELCYFVMTIPEISFEILSEETVFEDLAAAYFSLSSQLQQKKKKDAVIPILEEIRRLQFTVIMASTQTDPKRYSTIIDFLFNFIAGADTDVPRNSYITAIISQTPLLDRLTSIDAEDVPQKIHELSQLFPHTSKSILQATLSSTNYDLETATMLLLDNPSLESSSSPLPPPPPYEEYTPHKQSTNPTDELSALTVPTSRLYLGKRDISGTADNLLKDRSTAPTKSQILSALQAFDSDDDERDDTYDHEDVGAVDPTTATESEANNANNNNVTSGGTEEKALYNALVQNPGVFTRDAVTRRGNERKLLREVTGMSDEAIEGWKIMLDRDGGKRLRQLEIRFSRESEAGGGNNQTGLQRTAYRKGDEDEDESGEASGSGTNFGRGGGGHRGGNRGRGRGGRGFSGPNDRNVTGQQRDNAPVVNQDGKEPYVGKKTSKARGEHNRKMQSAARDRQRSKKMSKGMGGGV